MRRQEEKGDKEETELGAAGQVEVKRSEEM